MILPPTIPIFPLPNVVLFPNVFLPLHIFESRYRAMVKDALASDRIIGMVLLQPGFEANYEGRPPRVPGRLRRRHHAFGAAARRPIQHRAARAREVQDDRRGRRAGRTGSRTSRRCRKWSPTPTARRSSSIASGSRRCCGRGGASPRRDATAVDRAGSGSGQRAGAIRGVRAHRTAGAARVRRRAVAMPGAHRAARDEDDGCARHDLGRRLGPLKHEEADPTVRLFSESR